MTELKNDLLSIQPVTLEDGRDYIHITGQSGGNEISTYLTLSTALAMGSALIRAAHQSQRSQLH